MAGEIKQITLDAAVRQIHRTCQLHPHPDPQPFFFVVGAGISYPPVKLVLGCKSSRYLKSPFPKDHTIVRLARKWFVRRVFRAATAFSNSRMILKQVWVGKGTEVGSELLSRGFRCGDGEGGGGLRGRGKLCRVVLRTRKLVELPPPPPIPEESRADRPVSGRCLTTVIGSPSAVFSCVAASAARTRCRSSGVLVAREKRL